MFSLYYHCESNAWLNLLRCMEAPLRDYKVINVYSNAACHNLYLACSGYHTLLHKLLKIVKTQSLQHCDGSYCCLYTLH